MFGLVIVAHGGLAREFLAAAEHVVGRQAGAVAIGIAPDDDLAARQVEIRAAVAAVDTGEGVVVITDMFGGTPSNLAMTAAKAGLVEIVYGANLPMLVKLAKLRHLPLEDAVARAVEAGRKYINAAGAAIAARSGAAAS